MPVSLKGHRTLHCSQIFNRSKCTYVDRISLREIPPARNLRHFRSRLAPSSHAPRHSTTMRRCALLPLRAAHRPIPTFRSRPHFLNARAQSSIAAADLQFGQPLHETHPHIIQSGERKGIPHGEGQILMRIVNQLWNQCSHTRHLRSRIPPSTRRARSETSSK